MKAVFVELPPFEQHRSKYLDDDSFTEFQKELIKNPTAGEVIKGTGGLRKVRFSDKKRGKGKRGGVRIIYYWYSSGSQFWLFTLYGKGEADDLSQDERKTVAQILKHETEARKLL